MRVMKQWSDEDTVIAALFDDGHRMVFDEKSCALIDPAGRIIGQWWKEEPVEEHYCVLWKALGAEDTEEITEEIDNAIFDVGHRGMSAEAIAAAATLTRLLV